MQPTSDPRKPFVIGLIALAVLMIGGIAWAVMAHPTQQGTGAVDANVSFDDSNDPSTGKSDAKVVVRVFGDFECSACRTAESGFAYALQKYGDRVKFIWDDMPLENLHPSALLAANAARCAEEQGKFWEMHDKLYGQQPYWASAPNVQDLFIGYAGDLGMDAKNFTACLEDQRYNDKVTADFQEGTANNVDATPTFFVNNTRYVGVMSNEQWDAAIQKELDETK
jgi:protein-disulfide isomerase